MTRTSFIRNQDIILSNEGNRYNQLQQAWNNHGLRRPSLHRFRRAALLVFLLANHSILGWKVYPALIPLIQLLGIITNPERNFPSIYLDSQEVPISLDLPFLS
jgi:hypothetical protein